jgi:hypothetical protein
MNMSARLWPMWQRDSRPLVNLKLKRGEAALEFIAK